MTKGATTAARPCPICGRGATHEARPFCSKRCAEIDLHRWLSGHYSVPVVEEDTTAEPADPEDNVPGQRD